MSQRTRMIVSSYIDKPECIILTWFALIDEISGEIIYVEAISQVLVIYEMKFGQLLSFSEITTAPSSGQ
jgi:hypothetical protein